MSKQSSRCGVERSRADPSPNGGREEAAELQNLLAKFELLHGESVAQLDRTDAALDKALRYFAERG